MLITESERARLLRQTILDIEKELLRDIIDAVIHDEMDDEALKLRILETISI